MIKKTSEPLQEDILAIILASQPANKWYYRLDKQLETILRKEKNSLITKNFIFHPQYRDSSDLRAAISNMKLGGSIISYSHEQYRVSPALENVVAKRIAKYFSSNELTYLRKLGEKLKSK